MLYESVQFFFEIAQFGRATERGIEAKKGQNHIGLQTGQPLVGSFEEPSRVAFRPILGWHKILCSGKGVLFLLTPARMRSETGSVSFVAKVANYQPVMGET